MPIFTLQIWEDISLDLMDDIPKHIAIQVFHKAWFPASPPDLMESRFCIKRDEEGRLKIIYNGIYATIIDKFLNILNVAGRDQRDVHQVPVIQELLKEYQGRELQPTNFR